MLCINTDRHSVYVSVPLKTWRTFGERLKSAVRKFNFSVFHIEQMTPFCILLALSAVNLVFLGTIDSIGCNDSKDVSFL